MSESGNCMTATKKLTMTETTFGIIFWMAVMQFPLSLIGSDPQVFLHLELKHTLPVLGVAVAGTLDRQFAQISLDPGKVRALEVKQRTSGVAPGSRRRSRSAV